MSAQPVGPIKLIHCCTDMVFANGARDVHCVDAQGNYYDGMQAKGQPMSEVKWYRAYAFTGDGQPVTEEW